MTNRTSTTHEERALLARKALAEQTALRLLDTADRSTVLATLARTPGRRSLELRAAVLRLTEEAK